MNVKANEPIRRLSSQRSQRSSSTSSNTEEGVGRGIAAPVLEIKFRYERELYLSGVGRGRYGRNEGTKLIHLGPLDNCSNLEELLSRPNVSPVQLEAVKAWILAHKG